MSFVFRKNGTYDLFLGHGGGGDWYALDWYALGSESVLEYRDLSDGPSGRWESLGCLIEMSQAKRELEEHRLRELLVAGKPDCNPNNGVKTERAPAHKSEKHGDLRWLEGSHEVRVSLAADDWCATINGHLIQSRQELDGLIDVLTELRGELP